MYNDQETAPIPISIFPKRFPENFAPVSIIGSRTTSTTPKKPTAIPVRFLAVSLSPNKTKEKNRSYKGYACVKQLANRGSCNFNA